MRIEPRATYRLQLTPQFGFRAAADIVPYLAALGVSHLYLSPVLQAAVGSTHGYDVADTSRVSEELGGEAGFASLVGTVRAAGLGILLDIVPNHMSIAGARNLWWMDVLENGPASYYATYFDVDWDDKDARVLLPVLGERYGRALTSGVLAIVRDGDAYRVRAHDQLFPLAPRSLGAIVRRAAERYEHAELCFVGEALSDLPAASERDPAARARRHRHKTVLTRRLAELRADPAIADAIDAQLAAVSSDPTQLDAVLEAQNFRLAHWTVAANQLSFRRFFDITTLIGLRVEDPDVLAASHARIAGWLADRTIDGVRVDHVDGLRDPGVYLARLREMSGPDAWIVVEKILAPRERLPPSWPIDGTTGYDFGDTIGRLFLDPAGEAALTAAFELYTGQTWDPHTERRRARREVMTDALHSELARATELAVRACAASPACRDFTRAEIEDVLAELLAHYPAYRTYLGSAVRDIATREIERDRELLDRAVAATRTARPELDGDLVGYLAAALAFEMPSPEAQELAHVVQQTSGPIVAKGDEDTLSYRQIRLLVRSEVGGELAMFAATPAEVHADLAQRSPRALLATSTHDSKRGEDVRSRLAVLSELPDAWTVAVTRWGKRATGAWGNVERDRICEYLVWQTLVGAWPLTEARLQQYAEKATREARLRTSWRKPDDAYEAARRAWIASVFADATLISEIAAFAARLAERGNRNALAQLAIKLTAPGVPDLYQGSELATLTLVDPDNRQPVDYAARQALLDESRTLSRRSSRSHPITLEPREQIDGSEFAVAKLHLLRRVLEARRLDPAAFHGAYRPLAARGPHAAHVFAFTRGDAPNLVVVVPCLAASDAEIELPAGSWRDVVSDHRHEGAVTLGVLWRDAAVSVLMRA